MRVLVTTAKRHRGTREAAEAIARALRMRDVRVNIAGPRTVTDISAFDAVIVGSAVQSGHWSSEAVDFVNFFAAELWQRQLWVFSSGALGPFPVASGEDVGTARQQVLAGRVEGTEGGSVSPAAVRVLCASGADTLDAAAIDRLAAEIVAAHERLSAA